MNNYIKTLTASAALAILLAGCASNNDVEPEPIEDVVEETADETIDAPVIDEVDPLEGVASVFYFDFDSAILNSDSRAALLVHAEVLKETNNFARLEGHADERGSREYNMALGERRANAVKDFLVLQGVNASNLETVSYGEESPAAYGSDEAAWSQNRRVELK